MSRPFYTGSSNTEINQARPAARVPRTTPGNAAPWNVRAATLPRIGLAQARSESSAGRSPSAAVRLGRVTGTARPGSEGRRAGLKSPRASPGLVRARAPGRMPDRVWERVGAPGFPGPKLKGAAQSNGPAGPERRRGAGRRVEPPARCGPASIRVGPLSACAFTEVGEARAEGWCRGRSCDEGGGGGE
jgi:hypothetical protein